METNETQIENKLRSFISQHLGTEEIHLYTNSYEVPYRFENFETTLVIMYNFEGNRRFNILIKSFSESQDPCLILSINKDNSLYVNLIGTQDKTCSLPISRAGTWILQLIDHLAVELSLSYIYLQDESTVLCDNKRISLTLLRIYNGGKSWYENFGYKPKNIDYEEYEQLLKDYRSTPMIIVFDDVSKFILKDEQLSVVEPLEWETLGEYMSYIAKHDCKSYYQLENCFDRLELLRIPPKWINQRMKIEEHNMFSKSL
jgi:hypothetical protein